jgi:hypothetical protein
MCLLSTTINSCPPHTDIQIHLQTDRHTEDFGERVPSKHIYQQLAPLPSPAQIPSRAAALDRRNLAHVHTGVPPIHPPIHRRSHLTLWSNSGGPKALITRHAFAVETVAEKEVCALVKAGVLPAARALDGQVPKKSRGEPSRYSQTSAP